MGVSRRSRVPERITRPDERFDSSQVGPNWTVGSTIFEMWLGGL